MGVVQRQSIKNSIINYVAVAIGFVNVFIYTETLTKEQFGFFQFLLSSANLVMPFVLLGSNSLSIKYFPFFKNEKKGHNGFLALVLIYPIIGFSLLCILSLVFKERVFQYFENHEQGEYRFYFQYILYLVGVLSLMSVLVTYSSNFKRIVIPALTNNLFLKIAVPLIAILYYFHYFEFEGFIQGIIIVHFLALLMLVIYVKNLGQLYIKPNFSFIDKSMFKEMRNFQFYTLLTGMGNVLALRIDLIMVASILGWGYGGVYGLSLIISRVIEIPSDALKSISSPIIAEAWKKNDVDHISSLYKKTSINQFIVGVLIFIAICLSIDDLFLIIPNGEEYMEGKVILILLGIAKLIDIAAGLNGVIISYSKFYKFNLYALLVLAILNIVSNIVFIPIFELKGAAFATLLSILVFNLLKLIYLYIKTGLQPFSKNHIWVMLIAGLSYGIVCFIPSFGNQFLDIIINSALLFFIYSCLIYYSKVSLELNQLFSDSISKIIK